MPGRLIDTGSRAKKGDEFMMTKFETIQAISVPSNPEGFLFSSNQTENRENREITIHGSVHKIRKMSGFSFLILRTPKRLVQCVLDSDKCQVEGFLKEEACIRANALVVEEPRSKTGWELHLKRITVLSEPAEEMPVVINGKGIDASLETLLDYRPLTLRNEKQRAVFKIQEGLCRGFRAFLEKEEFTEIRTPKIVYQGAEGGANIFRLDYFGKDAYLAQSPQFYKQMMVGVYERVFEIGPVFRAEKHDTARHLNEYTSVDFEMGYINGFQDICQMEAAMIKNSLDYLQVHYGAELSLLKVRLPEADSIPSIRFHEAKELVAGRYKRPLCEKNDFEPEEEKLLSEIVKKETGSDFVFVTHYPTAKRPFYAMEDTEHPEVTLSFDLLFRGLEVTTGGQRIHDYGMQLAKMERMGMDPSLFKSYLWIHKAGMPPHGGLGLGLERFTARLLEMDNVRQAAMFPRDIHRVMP